MLLQFSVAECAVSQSFLELIQAKEERETYKSDGATSMAAWLSLKLGWSNQRADRVVRVARALADLPLIREAYAQGRICWEQVKALCCFATPETEEELLELCSSYLHTSAEAVRATVVIHAELEALKGVGTRIAALDAGPMVCGETVRRMCCDGHSELVLEGPDHEPIGIGRRSRQDPGWLWRVLWHRDQSCRFPGCERQRWIQNHHIQHWTRNGPTDKKNLVLLCWHHHHLVHEGGWKLDGNPNEWLDFISPAGHTLTSLPPPPLDPKLRDWLFDIFSGDPPEWDTG